ncbi:MAG TPA: TipAS antibiotic-recognition domain-containing protein [Mycobacteriales bacterium]|nr:TipAS antibiotic-recognition domain-containing protein [Mycobacteriales bacterium]
MSWSIAEVARMSRVTSRRLRHYDAIGLLPPARVGGNGYRYYEREQLLRLQQILLLRELGLGLEQIAAVLDGGEDPLETLRRHHAQVLAERDRLTVLGRTVARTIRQLEGGEDMSAPDLFEGFDHKKYEAEARERWGDEAVDESNRRYEALTDQQKADLQAEHEAVVVGLADSLGAGIPADDPQTLDLVDRHYRWMSTFRDVSAEGYLCLGTMYVEDSRFTQNYDKHRPGTAAYLREAIAAYVRERM